MEKELSISDSSEKVVEVKKEEKMAEKIAPTETPKVDPKIVKDVPVADIPLKKKINFKVFIFPIVAVLCVVGIGLFYYFGIYKIQPLPLNQVLPFNEDYISALASTSIFNDPLDLISQPEEPRTEASPINGLLFTKSEMTEMLQRRPVAVMINNHASARPQSGLNSADIVIEANAEGGITRYLAIFWSEAPEKVGSIRSLRQYYLEWLSEYDPILIHDGCASSDDPRINACGNVYSYGIKDISTIGAWRWNDGVRVSPHNEYSSITNAWEYAETMSWDSFPSTIDAWKFKKDASVSDRGNESVIKLTFHQRLNNGGLYDVIWTYDKSTNTYLRKVGGQADMDQETNTQVYAKNVVVQEVSMVQSGDDKGHLLITTIGSGEATFLMDGKISYGTWKKTSRTDRTMYYDASGNEISFNRGRIWIDMLPQSDGKFDIIE